MFCFVIWFSDSQQVVLCSRAKPIQVVWANCVSRLFSTTTVICNELANQCSRFKSALACSPFADSDTQSCCWVLWATGRVPTHQSASGHDGRWAQGQVACGWTVPPSLQPPVTAGPWSHTGPCKDDNTRRPWWCHIGGSRVTARLSSEDLINPPRAGQLRVREGRKGWERGGEGKRGQWVMDGSRCEGPSAELTE